MTDDQTPVAPAEPSSYNDDDLVYVDPDAKSVVGKVQWSNSGRPKPLAVPAVEDSGDQSAQQKKPPKKQRYFPWGTYRSMKNVYKIEGKKPKVESGLSLDDAIEKAIKEPFWD